MPQQDLPLFSPCPETIPPIPPHDVREVQPGTSDSIASRWQSLGSIDPLSPGFLPLLGSLTTGNNRSSTIELSGVDAKNTLSIMDEVNFVSLANAAAYITPSVQVLRDEKVPGERRRDTICAMRKLAYNSGQIPPRYQVNRNSLSREAGVFANGTFADIRRGFLDNKAVAVRTLRIDLRTNNDESKKVRVGPR